MKKRIPAFITSLLLVCVLLLTPLLSIPVHGAVSYPLTSSDTEVADALDYLRGEQTTDGSIGGFSPSMAWTSTDVQWVRRSIVSSK